MKLFTTQPCLIAIGPEKGIITSYMIAVDGNFIPIEASNAVKAFDQLFKSHSVLYTSYDKDLENFFNFCETVFYGIGKQKFSPRMIEVKSKILQEI